MWNFKYRKIRYVAFATINVEALCFICFEMKSRHGDCCSVDHHFFTMNTGKLSRLTIWVRLSSLAQISGHWDQLGKTKFDPGIFLKVKEMNWNLDKDVFQHRFACCFVIVSFTVFIILFFASLRTTFL